MAKKVYRMELRRGKQAVEAVEIERVKNRLARSAFRKLCELRGAARGVLTCGGKEVDVYPKPERRV